MRRLSVILCFLFGVTNCFAALTKPKQYLPADNSKNLPTAAKLYINNANYSNGTELVFQLSENSSFSSSKTQIVVKSGGSLFKSDFSKLKINQTYYWRVKARSNSDSSVWSNVWSFETVQPTEFYSPNNGSIYGPSMSFAWYRQHEYDSVEVQLDTVSTFNSGSLKRFLSIDTFTTFYGEQYIDSLKFGQKYFARYRGFNGSKNSGWSKSVNGIVYDSIHLSTQNPSGRTSTTNQFYWSGSLGTGYQFQLDTVLSFDSDILLDSVNSVRLEDYFVIKELMFDQTYYYRVRIISNNDTSNWSNRSFYTHGFKGLKISKQNNASPRGYLGIPATLSDVVGYQFQLDTSQSFKSIELFDSIVTNDKTVLYDSLLFGEVYYTRCRPFHHSDSGEWTVVNVFTTKSQLSTSYPFYNRMDVNINDSLTWSYGEWGVNNYQIQLSEKSDFSTLVIDSIVDTSSKFVGGFIMKFGTEYFHRIRGWHSRDTSDWSGVFSSGSGSKFTTIRNPTLKSPYNSSFLGSGASTTLVWNEMKGVNSYEVWLDTSKSFNSPMFLKVVVTQTNSLKLENLLFGEIYSWKVRAITSVDTSAFSDSWVFKVLNPVRLDLPKNNATNVTPTSLDWSSIFGTTGYLIHLDTNESFQKPIVLSSDTVKNPFFHYISGDSRIKFEQKYFWRVKVFHAKDTSDWSLVWTFTTKAKVAPTLVYPEQNSNDIPLGISFTWDKYSGASTYIIQYSENSNFTPVQQQVVSSNTRSVALKPSTTYFWRVKSRNSQGQEFGDWSDVWSFSTRKEMEIPVLISPLNNLKDASINQTLTWSPIAGTNYDVEYDDNESFSSPISASTPSSTRVLKSLEGRKTFYWRVRAKNVFTTGKWSETWSFTTGKGLSAPNTTISANLIYPNPFTNTLNVVCPKQIDRIVIHNINGLVVFTKAMKTTQLEIDLYELNTGVYFITLYFENSLITHQKVIKY